MDLKETGPPYAVREQRARRHDQHSTRARVYDWHPFDNASTSDN